MLKNEGIIPARAGFTVRRTAGSPTMTDHPRSRGVYDHLRRPLRHGQGSSPLARGLRFCVVAVDVVLEIIPARAGFTTASPPRTGTRRDHPRSRGVYLWQTEIQYNRTGSSPLARGLHSVRLGQPDRVGIIPARAGFTTCTSPPNQISSGSSPLARGLRRLCGLRSGRRRIIPARAGFTRSHRGSAP